jgi:hypothetical protein
MWRTEDQEDCSLEAVWRTGGVWEKMRTKRTVSGVTNLNLNGQLQMNPVHHFLRRILAVGVWVQRIVSP